MKHITFGNRLTLYLLLSCVLLAGILTVESTHAPRLEVDALLEQKPAPPGEVLISRTQYMPPPIRAFDEILKRPLFNESRLPPPPPPEKVAARPTTVAAHIRLKLEGVAITPGARIAVLRDLTTQKMLHLAEGATHNAWKLESVHTDKALFKFNQQTVELELVQEKNTPGEKMGNPREVQTGVNNPKGKQ
jgi:hypothetical protein